MSCFWVQKNDGIRYRRNTKIPDARREEKYYGGDNFKRERAFHAARRSLDAQGVEKTILARS
jgi:hypothetical protein